MANKVSETQLYRHFDKAGNLLYVGVSLDALYRLGQHKNNAQWFGSIALVTIERFPTRGAALAAERIAIEIERPHHNKRNARLAEGWRVEVWAGDASVRRSFTYQLIAAGKLKTVRLGRARFITTSPAEYLASLPPA